MRNREANSIQLLITATEALVQGVYETDLVNGVWFGVRILSDTWNGLREKVKTRWGQTELTHYCLSFRVSL